MDPDPGVDAATRNGRLAAWATAWLRGRCSREQAVDGIVGPDSLHLVTGWPGAESAVPVGELLTRLEAAQVRGLRYLTAAAGDASDLPGPSDFNARAVAAGGACVTAGGPALGLVGRPERHGPIDDAVCSVTWQVLDVEPRPLPPVDLREARRRFVEEVQAGLDQLHRLDVVRPRPDADSLLAQWRAGTPAVALPAASPPEAANLLDRATHVRQVVLLAQSDDGGAVSGWEAEQRRQTLRHLERAVRHVAADAWNCGLLGLAGPAGQGAQ